MYSPPPVNEPPVIVGWDMSLNGKPLGWAASKIDRAVGDMARVRSHIHFDRVPLEELSPAWMRALVRTAVSSSTDDSLKMDAFTEMLIDSLGHLSQFGSTLHVANMVNAIRIDGKIRASLLSVKVKAGDLVYPWETYLPSDALVTDELSPQSRMADLHVGQEWTVPVFSPLRDPRSPVEVLQAQVECRDLLMWDSETVPVSLVVYRADSGSALSSTRQPRVRLWVREDGTVLKQEVTMFGSKLAFLRLSDERSAQLTKDSDEIEKKFQSRGRWGRGRPSRAPDETEAAASQVPSTETP
jgi:hypothetical protein